MNAEEEEPKPEMPERIRKALEGFSDMLKRALNESANIRLNPVPQGDPKSVKTPFSMMPKGVADMSASAIESIVHSTLPPILNKAGIRVALFTKYTDEPVLTSNEALVKLLTPSWKLHSFRHRTTRVQGDELHMHIGDKLVIVSPNAYSVSVLSYYVTGTSGLPDEDDYKALCAFAGGCSLEPDLLLHCELEKLCSVLGSSLFDPDLVAPPVIDTSLQDLLNDPEFLLIQDLLN